MIRRFLKDERGVTMVEYGLIVAMIALATAIGFGSAANQISYLWGDNNSRLQEALNENRDN